MRELRDLLVPRGWLVAVAESVTAGRIQSLLTTHSGSSQFFAGGITTYNLQQKVRLLGVDEIYAARTHCVSEQTCREMARGVAELFQVPIALAITGYAEPERMHSVDEPFAYVSIWWGSGGDPTHGNWNTQRLLAVGTRNEVQQRFAAQAVEYLLENLQSLA